MVAIAQVEERVSRLEEVFAHYMEHTELMLASMREEDTEFRISIARTDRKLLEMQQQANRKWSEVQQQAEKDRQQADRKWSEMQQQAEKDRQQAEKDRQLAEKDRKDFNRRLAQSTDSQGLMIENMVWPNLNRIAGELFDGEVPLASAIRIKRRRPDVMGENMEIDLLAAGTKEVLVCEAKSKVDASKAADFLKKLKVFPDYFPEYVGHRLLPMMASIAFEESVLRHLTSRGIYALGFGDETMELLNAKLIGVYQ